MDDVYYYSVSEYLGGMKFNFGCDTIEIRSKCVGFGDIESILGIVWFCRDFGDNSC